MDIFDILLDILLKPPQPFIGLFLPFQSESTIPDQYNLFYFCCFFLSPKLSLSFFNCSSSPMNVRMEQKGSLRSVSSTNYPTSHHPQLSIVFFKFFFTCLQILCITKYYNIQRIQNQIHKTFTHVLAYKT